MLRGARIRLPFWKFGDEDAELHVTIASCLQPHTRFRVQYAGSERAGVAAWLAVFSAFIQRKRVFCCLLAGGANICVQIALIVEHQH